MRNRPQTPLDDAVMATCDATGAGSAALRDLRQARELRSRAAVLDAKADDLAERADALDAAAERSVDATVSHTRRAAGKLDALVHG